ncbi:hypothetical protein [Streptomyces sp. NPDC055055]
MGHHDRRHTPSPEPSPRTTPSEAVGESGDVDARREAEAAQKGHHGDTADDDERGRNAKHQSPGLGREEQRRPLGRRGDAEEAD